MRPWLSATIQPNRRSTSLVGLLVLVGFLMLSRAALGFDVTPTVSVMELPKDTGGKTLNVRNPRTVALPVEFEIVERAVNADGSEDMTPADDLFLIFPPQAVIAPGDTQSVRVQWMGSPLAQSRSFTLFASEIPVDLEDRDEPTVQTIFRMGASVHVTPGEARASPRLISAEDTAGGVRLTLGNSGDRFYYIDSLSLTFSESSYTGLELANIAGRTLVPPGASRTFTIPNVTGTPNLKLLE